MILINIFYYGCEIDGIKIALKLPEIAPKCHLELNWFMTSLLREFPGQKQDFPVF